MERTEICEAISNYLGTDEQTIIYRPKLLQIAKSINSVILLSQIVYWYLKMNKKFYKFKLPCSHQLYRPGDSWCEELGFTRAQFDLALKNIGCNVKRATKEEKDKALVWYKTIFNCTYYDVNIHLLYDKLSKIYPDLNKKEINKMVNKQCKSKNKKITKKNNKKQKVVKISSKNNNNKQKRRKTESGKAALENKKIKTNTGNRDLKTSVPFTETNYNIINTNYINNPSDYNTSVGGGCNLQNNLDQHFRIGGKINSSKIKLFCKTKNSLYKKKKIRNVGNVPPKPPHSKYKITAKTYRVYNQCIALGATKHRDNTKAYFNTLDSLHAIFSSRCKKPYDGIVTNELYFEDVWTEEEFLETFEYYMKSCKENGIKPIKAVNGFIASKSFNGSKAWSPLIVYHQRMCKAEPDQLTEKGLELKNCMDKHNIDHKELTYKDLNNLAQDIQEIGRDFHFRGTLNLQYDSKIDHFVKDHLREKLNNYSFRLVFVRKKNYIDEYFKTAVYEGVYAKKAVQYIKFYDKQITMEEFLSLSPEERRKERHANDPEFVEYCGKKITFDEYMSIDPLEREYQEDIYKTDYSTNHNYFDEIDYDAIPD